MENGKMNIEWIGTGSGLNPTLGNTSFLVSGEGDRTLLVDAGCTVPLKLIEMGKLNDVTDILITHAHADHTGGLEGIAFMNYFAYRKREEDRPNLYLATDKFAHNLWENSLKGGLGKINSDDNEPMDTIFETYFKIHIGKDVKVPGIPTARMFPTLHVKGKENYGVNFDNGVFYSGDTVEPPPMTPEIIFQDCQFFETKSDVHISYDKLKRLIPAEIRSKIHLVHFGGGYDKKDAKADGFGGFVMPGQKFEF